MECPPEPVHTSMLKDRGLKSTAETELLADKEIEGTQEGLKSFIEKEFWFFCVKMLIFNKF